VRDLLGITRALYRTTLVDEPRDVGRLQALEEIGTTLRAVLRAAHAHPGDQSPFGGVGWSRACHPGARSARWGIDAAGTPHRRDGSTRIAARFDGVNRYVLPAPLLHWFLSMKRQLLGSRTSGKRARDGGLVRHWNGLIGGTCEQLPSGET
jgi:hypothetical protein